MPRSHGAAASSRLAWVCGVWGANLRGLTVLAWVCDVWGANPYAKKDDDSRDTTRPSHQVAPMCLIRLGVAIMLVTGLLGFMV